MENMAQVAYEAYRDAWMHAEGESGWLRTWDQLPPVIQGHWDSVAQAVMLACDGPAMMVEE